MAKLILLVNDLAPGTAIDIEIHFPANLCKSVIETWVEFRIALAREINFCFLCERREKACKGSHTETPDKELIEMAEEWISEAQYSNPALLTYNKPRRMQFGH